jgi:hypothetical protein
MKNNLRQYLLKRDECHDIKQEGMDVDRTKSDYKELNLNYCP